MSDTSGFKGWPSGDCKPVLELKLSPGEIESRFNLTFTREKDDLDWYMGAHFNDPIVGSIVMMQHENNPSKGTVVYVDANIETVKASKRISHILNLDNAAIAWDISRD